MFNVIFYVNVSYAVPYSSLDHELPKMLCRFLGRKGRVDNVFVHPTSGFYRRCASTLCVCAIFVDNIVYWCIINKSIKLCQQNIITVYKCFNK